MRILLPLALLAFALLAGAPANAAMPMGGHAGQFGTDPTTARRQNDINECARKYPSFDSLSKTYKGRDGRRHSCFE